MLYVKNRVVVVGGGAAGMVAAILAARSHAEVLILEHNDRVGKKILVTGNGRCNLTNEKMDTKFFRSDCPEFVTEVLRQFSYMQTKQFFEELGILLKSRDGYCYPASGQASAVLDVLRMELEYQKVQVLTDTHVKKIIKKQTFIIETETKKIEAEKIIIAAGSKAASKQGSDGSGYELLRLFGHRIISPVPALVQIRCKADCLKQWAGIRVDGKVSVMSREKLVAYEQGELQLTDYGISGIPVFQVSRYVAKALERHVPVYLQIDFLPNQKIWESKKFLEQRYKMRKQKSLEEGMIGLFPKKLIPVILKQAKLSSKKRWSELSEKEKEVLLMTIKQFPLTVTGVNSFEQAQVCAGGADLKQFCSDTMESKLVKGLYAAGEVLDVDGMCGGYNLQWAWATGAIAGKAAGTAVLGGKGSPIPEFMP